MPKREAVIRVSEEVQALNRSAFIDQQRAMTDMQAHMQRQVWTVFGVALAISLAIAWLASRHGTRLEHRLTEQRAREEQIAADLHRLSARLVQAQEDEQRRIARELHDEVGQALSAVNVELTVAQRRLERTGGAGELLSDALSSANSALRTVRNLSRWLHPSALEDLGLIAALESQIADFRRRHGIDMVFTHDGLDDRHNPEIERAVYRIVQEALTNIAKHAQATAGCVHVHADADRLHIVVEDNGIGFDVDDAERPGKRRGLGLLGIRERISQLTGTVTIESLVTRGTRIDVALPNLLPSRTIDDLHEESALEAAFITGETGGTT
jgi:signal transduction histidine kinase